MLQIRDLSVDFSPPTTRSILARMLFRRRKDTQIRSEILRNLDLEVQSGDFIVVLGKSGSGKTTLLRSIAGLIGNAKGDIFLNGFRQNLLPPHKRDVAYVFQNGGWYDHLTVRQHFQIGESSAAKTGPSNFGLERLGLAEFANQTPRSLSGGQLQRLAIGRAVARGKSLLLMDEPLSQLDGVARDDLRKLIQEIHREGITIVYVTHDQHDAFLLATKIAILAEGKIQQIDTPQNTYDYPRHISVARAIGSPTMEFFVPEQIVGSDSISFGSEGTFPNQSLLGVRPRDWKLALCETGGTSGPSISGEWVGATFYDGQILGKVRISNEHITVLIDDLQLVKDLPIGQKCFVTVDFSRIHVFDRLSGLRLERGKT